MGTLIIVLMTGWLLAISFMDIRTRRIPVWLLIPGGILTGTASVYQYSGCFDLLRGLLPGMLLLVVALVTKKAGYGDGVVLICLGAVVGGEKALLLFGFSLFLVSVFSLILLALRKVGRNTAIPFLPFLTAAWVVFAVL